VGLLLGCNDLGRTNSFIVLVYQEHQELEKENYARSCTNRCKGIVEDAALCIALLAIQSAASHNISDIYAHVRADSFIRTFDSTQGPRMKAYVDMTIRGALYCRFL
jgi:hypothetical protein